MFRAILLAAFLCILVVNVQCQRGSYAGSHLTGAGAAPSSGVSQIQPVQQTVNRIDQQDQVQQQGFNPFFPTNINNRFGNQPFPQQFGQQPFVGFPQFGFQQFPQQRNFF